MVGGGKGCRIVASHTEWDEGYTDVEYVGVEHCCCCFELPVVKVFGTIYCGNVSKWVIILVFFSHFGSILAGRSRVFMSTFDSRCSQISVGVRVRIS